MRLKGLCLSIASVNLDDADGPLSIDAVLTVPVRISRRLRGSLRISGDTRFKAGWTLVLLTGSCRSTLLNELGVDAVWQAAVFIGRRA